jgi:hypothetical protein
LFHGSINNVCLPCAGSTFHMHQLCSHSSMLSSSMFSKLLIAHTMSRILDLISSLGEPCKSWSSWSRRSFLHDWTSVTEFMEDHARAMLYTASNTVFHFHNAITLSSSSARVLRRSAQ